MRTPTTAISAGQLLRMPEDCVRYELAKGSRCYLQGLDTGESLAESTGGWGATWKRTR